MPRFKVDLDVDLNTVGGEVVVEAESAEEAVAKVDAGDFSMSDVRHDAESTDPEVESVHTTGEAEEE
jgi:hypothetical protein